jgi:hypothetical protein
MLKKAEDTSACKHCGAAFRKKRTGQEMQRGKSLTSSSVPHGEALLMALFLQLNQMSAKPPSTPDLAAFVRAQIVEQQDEPNPRLPFRMARRVGFVLPVTKKAQRSSAMTGFGGQS